MITTPALPFLVGATDVVVQLSKSDGSVWTDAELESLHMVANGVLLTTSVSSSIDFKNSNNIVAYITRNVTPSTTATMTCKGGAFGSGVEYAISYLGWENVEIIEGITAQLNGWSTSLNFTYSGDVCQVEDTLEAEPTKFTFSLAKGFDETNPPEITLSGSLAESMAVTNVFMPDPDEAQMMVEFAQNNPSLPIIGSLIFNIAFDDSTTSTVKFDFNLTRQ